MNTLMLALLLSVPCDIAPAGYPDGVVDIADVVTALRLTVGLKTPQRWPERSLILELRGAQPFTALDARMPWEWRAGPPTRIDCQNGGRFLQWGFVAYDVVTNEDEPWLFVVCEWDDPQEGRIEPIRVFYRGSHPIATRQPGIPPPNGGDFVPYFPWVQVVYDDGILGFGSVRTR